VENALQGYSVAYGINDQPQIVGTSWRPAETNWSAGSAAVIWQRNDNEGGDQAAWEITDLNRRLIDTNWLVNVAVGINNDGLILAQAQKPITDNDDRILGYQPRAVLLIPFSLLPGVLPVNSDFDEGIFDQRGLLQADSVDPDPTDVQGSITAEILEDYYQPLIGKPFTDHLDGNVSIIIRKDTTKFDFEIGNFEEGQIRIIAIRESDNAWVEVPLNANIVPEFLRPGGSHTDYKRWYVEGVRPGRITLEFLYMAPEKTITLQQRALVATHKSRAQWRREVQRQILLQTRGIADLRGFNPYGKEFSEN